MTANSHSKLVNYRLNVAGMDPNEFYVEVPPNLKDFVRKTSEEGFRKKIFFYGPPGVGKTTLARSIAREVILENLSRKYTVNFVDLTKVHNDFNLALVSKDDAKARELLKRIESIADSDFIILDDVGIKSASETFMALMLKMLGKERPMVITSNLPLSTIDTIYGARISDRLRAGLTNIKIDRPSFRRENQ